MPPTREVREPSTWTDLMKEKSSPRPFLVGEFTASYNYHGRDWTVGCKTEEAALRAFERRVQKNMSSYGGEGAVIAWERDTRRILAATGEVSDPRAALDFFVWHRSLWELPSPLS
jgi:hypothetical protein